MKNFKKIFLILFLLNNSGVLVCMDKKDSTIVSRYIDTNERFSFKKDIKEPFFSGCYAAIIVFSAIILKEILNPYFIE